MYAEAEQLSRNAPALDLAFVEVGVRFAGLFGVRGAPRDGTARMALIGGLGRSLLPAMQIRQGKPGAEKRISTWRSPSGRSRTASMPLFAAAELIDDLSAAFRQRPLHGRPRHLCASRRARRRQGGLARLRGGYGQICSST